MEIVGTAVDKLFDELGYIGTCGPLGRQISDLLFAWDLASEEEPEET